MVAPRLNPAPAVRARVGLRPRREPPMISTRNQLMDPGPELYGFVTPGPHVLPLELHAIH
jgi:hypothetical protein